MNQHPLVLYTIVENLTGIHEKIYTLRKEDNYSLIFDNESFITFDDVPTEGFHVFKDDYVRMYITASYSTAVSMLRGIMWQSKTPTVGAV